MAVLLADSTWSDPVNGGGIRSPLARIWEVERDRLGVWSPLFLVAGIWSYFALAREPPLALAVLAIGLAFVLLWRFRSNKMLAILALVLAGFGTAKLRAEWVATPLLRAHVPEVRVSGWVREVDRRGKLRRVLVVDVASAHGIPEGEVPLAMRITATAIPEQDVSVGDRITFSAGLGPLPRPVAPAAFDYGRQLYFQGIGAVGHAKAIATVEKNAVPWSYKLRRTFHDLRSTIGERVRAVVRGPLGSLAEALITGERASIPKSLNSSLQASGLFHILSISGLHMSLVAGGAFWAVRAVLAIFPGLALRHPIKKWAAVAAVGVGLLYMLLADSGAATERSFIMIAVVFFAVLVDRPAISLHNLAVAAVIILLMEPEQALSASFQMSFMAVMGLAAFFPAFEAATAKLAVRTQSGFVGRWSRGLALLVLASIATSLIAGTLSSVPAAHHFGRVAPFAVVSNALALPILGVVVMPAAMASTFLMPLGLEALPLRVMELGLAGVVGVSDWVASWPAAQIHLPFVTAPAAVLLTCAAALLCLSASRLRWVSLPCVGVAALLLSPPKPLLLFDDRAANVALLGEEGYVPAIGKRASFSAARWLQQNGEGVSVAEASKRTGWNCTEKLCDAAAGKIAISYLRRAAEQTGECPTAHILLAEFPLRRRCKGNALTVDRFDVWRSGAHAIYLAGDSIHVITAKEEQGERPWAYASRPRTANIFSRKRP